MNEIKKQEAFELECLILTIRGRKVILSQDLAALFGVETRVLNQAVKRNPKRFPGTFLFQLTKEEYAELITKRDNLSKFLPALPYAFTEHGALMAANVLNSDRAIEMSIHLIEAFVAMRRMSGSIRELSDKIKELDAKYIHHDKILKLIADVMKKSGGISSPREIPAPKKKIGFQNKKKNDLA